MTDARGKTAFTINRRSNHRNSPGNYRLFNPFFGGGRGGDFWMRCVTVTTEGRAALQSRSVRLIYVGRLRRTRQPSRYPVSISLAETPTFLRLSG